MSIELLERRRDLINVGAAIPELEHPDAFMAVFSCNANTARAIMYQAVINRYILDGIEYKPSNPVASVTPLTDGRHILYFWINSSNRLANTVNINYIRIPENPTYWHQAFYYSSWTLGQIDFLSPTPPPMNSSFGVGSGTRYVKVRVPIGSSELYRQAFQKVGGEIKNRSTIIETKDFTYS